MQSAELSTLICWTKEGDEVRGIDVPQRAGDVGYDLFTYIQRKDQTWLDLIVSWFTRKPTIVLLPIIGQRNIPSGVKLVMPDEIWCKIEARSSTSRKKLHILGGIIDSGYRGEIYTVIHNFGFLPRLIIDRHRYAQVVFYPACRPEGIFIDHFTFSASLSKDKNSRGTDGFGSTGAN